MDRPKSCPFCGSTKTLSLPIQSGLRWLAAVECSQCSAVGPVKFSMVRSEAMLRAVEAWNRAHGVEA